MIPIRDHNPTRRRAIVTLALLVINIATFVLLQPRNGAKAVVPVSFRTDAQFADPETEFLFGAAAIPCEVVAGEPLSEDELRAEARGLDDRCTRKPQQGIVFPSKQPLLSVLVAAFLHGGWMHLLGNMLFLWIFGNNIEDALGRIRFLIFYLLAAVAAAAVYIAVNPNSTTPMVGASGAIAGVMGAYLVLYPKVKVTALFMGIPIPFRVRAWILLGIWFVTQFYVAENSQIAWHAHVGGFVFGVIAAVIGRRLFKTSTPSSPEQAA